MTARTFRRSAAFTSLVYVGPDNSIRGSVEVDPWRDAIAEAREQAPELGEETPCPL